MANRADSPDSNISFHGGDTPESRDNEPPGVTTRPTHAKRVASQGYGGYGHTSPPTGTDDSHLQLPSVTGIKRFSRKNRQLTRQFDEQQKWEKHPRGPYHEYIHKLVLAGWDNLTKLDEYMCRDEQDVGLIVSVVDITQEDKLAFHADLNNEAELKDFLGATSRVDSKVRLYLVEQKGELQPGVIETFGSALSLDPRYFQWNVFGSTNLMDPAERHRAPYVSIGFTILKTSTATVADTEFFRVTVYVKPDGEGDGWTGVVIFSTHSPITLSTRFFTSPPPFNHPIPIPPPTIAMAQSFRQLYLAALATGSLDNVELAVKSPFYCLSPLIRLNHRCWDMVISTIRQADREQGGISNTSVTHVEEIKKTLSLVERGGSLAWKNDGGPPVEERKKMLKEDLTHLINQADLMWQARTKWHEILDRKKESRTTALTNSFTYIFVPISLITGVYGMNVSQISGSNTNPNIWQFFVAVVGVNVIIVVALAVSHWINEYRSRARKPGFSEVIRFAVGKKVIA